MTYADIITNEKLLTQMTQQENELLTHEQKCERLLKLMKLRSEPTSASGQPCPF